MKDKTLEIERIVKTYSDFLLRLVLHDTLSKSEAEDIVQNTFIKYVEKAPIFQDEKHEKAWLIRVASNGAKDFHRSWWKKKTIQFDEQEEIVVEKEKAFVLLPYIRQLPQGSRRAIYLFYYEGFSVSQIANIYQVKEDTVTSWLHRGRKKLKEMMKGEFDDGLE